MKYVDRYEAGRLLAERLTHYRGEHPIVLALPRGGVPVAYEIAKELSAPLDLLIVRKIGAPLQKELAIGAVAEDGTLWKNEQVCRALQISDAYFNEVLHNEQKNIQYQSKALRDGNEPLSWSEKTIIVVDDGIATGASMLAAIELLKKRNPKKIIVAVPVSSPQAIELLRERVDEVVVGIEDPHLRAVGFYYSDFGQIENEVVQRLMQLHNKPKSGTSQEVVIPIDESNNLNGIWSAPHPSRAVVIFVHGSGSSRMSPRNQKVARELNRAGYSTLLFDLLTEEESENRKNVFDIGLLSERLMKVTRWTQTHLVDENQPLIYFGASTGAAAALVAAAQKPFGLSAVISRGGRPDLAMHALPEVGVPVLLIVGGLDYLVLDLNRKAAERLELCELRIVDGASHIFEEKGAMEEVVALTTGWVGDILTQREVNQSTKRTTYAQALHQISKPLNSKNVIDSIVSQVKDKKIVMLGEATHGTEEFYKWRSEISLELIKNHGFSFISVEGDWPEASLLNEYIHGEYSNESAKQVLSRFDRWPTWMWANAQVAALGEGLKKLKSSNIAVDYYGLDVYSLYSSMDAVIRFTEEFYPELSEKIIERYSCFDPYRKNEVGYVKSLLRDVQGCTDEVTETLTELLKIRIENVPKYAQQIFDAQMNARVVKNAERYYRAMVEGADQSWNARDRHMLEVLEILLEKHGPKSKGIVWAHNTHVGDYRATDMLKQGYVNIGGLAREKFGAKNVALIGFGTFEGTVVASSRWDGNETIFDLPQSAEGSLDAILHEMCSGEGLVLSWLNQSPAPELKRTITQRAVGVVYNPLHESRSNYVPTQLTDRYDGYVFIDHTNALESFQRPFQGHELPDLWPSAL